MVEASKEELKETKGGFAIWIGLGITALVIFAAGVIDGIVRPLKCND